MAKKKTWKDCKSLDEMEDSDTASDFFGSDEFKDSFRKQIEADTWGKGHPMIYMDENGDMIRHYKDGRKEIIRKKGEGI